MRPPDSHLNVTIAEMIEIMAMIKQCERGPKDFDERRWLDWMKERFGVEPGQYELVVHGDVSAIPAALRITP